VNLRRDEGHVRTGKIVSRDVGELGYVLGTFALMPVHDGVFELQVIAQYARTSLCIAQAPAHLHLLSYPCQYSRLQAPRDMSTATKLMCGVTYD